MRKIFVVIFILAAHIGYSQEFGLSFSYFLPKNGDFSTPISPFSFRGVGVNMGRYFALETGISLYRMSGLNIKDTPLDSRKSLVGPNFTFFIPGEFVIQLPAKNFEFDIKGGGFVFYGLGQKLNYGNIDRAIRTMESWDVVNSQFSFRNSPGYGIHAGVELSVNVTKQFGISLEVNYLIGASGLPLTGSYTGGSMTGPLQTKEVSYDDAKVDFTGLEVSIGVFMLSNSGPQRPKKRR
jgi:hypothetical protein